jgi:hypothetical protein
MYSNVQYIFPTCFSSHPVRLSDSLINVVTVIFLLPFSNLGLSEPRGRILGRDWDKSWYLQLISSLKAQSLMCFFIVQFERSLKKHYIVKPNSWTYNFVEVSEHNLESSQTLGLRMQCLLYKPVSNRFCSNPLVEVTVNSKEEKT